MFYFDEKYYLNNNPDLINWNNTFGNVISHFYSYGFKESRKFKFTKKVSLHINQKIYPEFNSTFTIPCGIYFIYTIDKNLSINQLKTTRGRFLAYIEWKKEKYFNYPGIVWNIPFDEIYNYISLIFNKKVLTKNDREFLLEIFFENPLFYYFNSKYHELIFSLDNEYHLPNYIIYLFNKREDLLKNINKFKSKKLKIKYILQWAQNYLHFDHDFFFSFNELKINNCNKYLTFFSSNFNNFIEQDNFLNFLRSFRNDLKSYDDDFLVEWFKLFFMNEYKPILKKNKKTIIKKKYTKDKHINIIGFSESYLGIGEDARNFLSIFRKFSCNISYVIPEINGPKSDISLEEIYKKNIYYYGPNVIDFISLPLPEIFRLIIESPFDFFCSNNLKIAQAPWELPFIPIIFKFLNNHIDEFWCQSQFVLDAFSKIFDKEKLYKINNPFIFNKPKSKPMIKNQIFSFLVLFDFNSWISRKNPMQIIKNFGKIFPKDSNLNNNIELIIKILNFKPDSIDGIALLNYVHNDKRIKLITSNMNKNEINELINNSDAFISLHKSEGFGRVLVESMSLRTLVISSDFSGSQDFLNNHNSLLVTGELTPLVDGDYLFTDGQYWFEPSNESLKIQLKKAMKNNTTLIERAYLDSKKFSLNGIMKQIKLSNSFINNYL